MKGPNSIHSILVRTTLALIAICASLTICQSTAHAQDKFDGAIWAFTLKPLNSSRASFRGRFRVSDHAMYQREATSGNDYNRPIGEISPNGNLARLEVKGMRVYNADGGIAGQKKGTGRIHLEKFGQWSGNFTDAKGRKYNFRCTRIIE